MKQTYTFVLSLLGVLVAAPGVINIIQNGYAFSLGPFFLSILEYYRGIVHPVMELFYAPVRPVLAGFGLVVPTGLFEVHAISFVATGIFFRSSFARLLRTSNASTELVAWQKLFSLGVQSVFLALGYFVYSLSLIGLVLLPIALFSPLILFLPDLATAGSLQRYLRDASTGEMLQISARAWLTSLATGAAVVVFYIGNLLTG